MNIAVIGSGIAGASVAHALRDHDVTVFEQGDKIAPEASGNPAALVMPRMDIGATPEQVMYIDAFKHAIALYEELDAFTARGVMDYSYPADKVAKLREVMPFSSDWTIEKDGGFFHAKAGAINPKATIKKMLAGATVLVNAGIDDVNDLRDDFDAIVICAGRMIGQFTAAPLSNLRYRAGQVDWMQGHAAPMMGKSYVVPLVLPQGDNIIFGATHELWQDPRVLPETSMTATQENLDNLKSLNPACAIELPVWSRASLRVTALDRLPIAGAADNKVYMLGSLSGRGFTLAPLLGASIAADILGQTNPLSTDLRRLISPARYLT